MCVGGEGGCGTEGDVLDRGPIGRAELHPDASGHQDCGCQHHIPQSEWQAPVIRLECRDVIKAVKYLENSVNEAAGMTKIERKNNGRAFKVVTWDIQSHTFFPECHFKANLLVGEVPMRYLHLAKVEIRPNGFCYWDKRHNVESQDKGIQCTTGQCRGTFPLISLGCKVQGVFHRLTTQQVQRCQIGRFPFIVTSSTQSFIIHG